MARSTSDRILPSLLDRLTDEAPQQRKESAESRFMTLDAHRESVVRDVANLLNCESLESTVDLTSYPEVASSVVNYGVREVVGVTASGLDVREMEGRIRAAIERFEPRIIPGSLVVKTSSKADAMTHNAVTFAIEAQLWALPTPIRLLLQTELDLETGMTRVADVTEN